MERFERRSVEVEVPDPDGSDEGFRPPVIVVILVMFVVFAGFVYWWSQRPDPLIGDRGEVVAEVGADCRYFMVRIDGVALRGLATDSAWRGRDVPGRLEIIEVRDHEWARSVRGVFVAEDGRSIEVEGGEGNITFTADCPTW